jgi:NADH-quinone oxidoreductase subunit L
VFLTAFYMFRAIFMTFHGEYRGGDKDSGKDYSHTHESPKVMVAPLVFLALLAIGAGWWNVNGGFNTFMGYDAEAGSGFGAFFSVFTHIGDGVAQMSLAVALLGIFSAYAVYLKRWITAEKIGKFFGPLYGIVRDKYYFDELYENIIVKLALVKGLFTGFQLFDSKGVDGAVNGAADIVVRGGKAIRQAQTGQLQLYGLFIIIGIAIIGICMLLFGR